MTARDPRGVGPKVLSDKPQKPVAPRSSHVSQGSGSKDVGDRGLGT